MALKSAVAWPDGKAYLFFDDDVYDRYDLETGRIEARALPITDWPGLPGAPDSFLWWGAGKAIAFYGEHYVRYDVVDARADEGYDPPRRIRGSFPGMDQLPDAWAPGFDACVNWGNGQTYLFRADQVVRFDVSEDRVSDGYPRPARESWPAEIADGVDAALYTGGRFAYFFRGSEYVRYDLDADSVDAPRPITAFVLDPTPAGGVVPTRQLTQEQATVVLADLVSRGLLRLEGGRAPEFGEPVTIAPAIIRGVRFTNADDGGSDRLPGLDQRLAVALYRLTRWMNSRAADVSEIHYFPVTTVGVSAGDGTDASRVFEIAGFSGAIDGETFIRTVLQDWGALPQPAEGTVRLDRDRDPVGDDLFRLVYGFGTYECESSALGADNRFPPLSLGAAGYVRYPDYGGDPAIRAKHQDRVHMQIGPD